MKYIRAGALALGWMISAVALALSSVHWFLGDGILVVAWLHATYAWWIVGLLPWFIVCLISRSRSLVVGAALPLVGWGVCNAPPLWSDASDAPETVTLVSGNQLMVNRDPDAWLAEVMDADPDVLVIQEFTPDMQARVTGFPHRIEHPETHSFGGAIYSRLPIVDARAVVVHEVEVLQVDLDVNGRPLTVWNVHTLPPVSARNHALWRAQVGEVAAMARDVRSPLVVAGDFNLTPHHGGYGELTSVLDDAHRRCGRWVSSSWPNTGLFSEWPVPRIRLDHVFLGGAVDCVEISELPGAGSDHRPIRVVVGL